MAKRNHEHHHDTPQHDAPAPQPHAATGTDVIAVLPHTVHGIDRKEGDRYTVDDPALADSLVGIGFVRLADKR